MNIAGLLLAAGSASRFGSDKLRHPLPHGVPIAVQALRNLASELGEVVAFGQSFGAVDRGGAEPPRYAAIACRVILAQKRDRGCERVVEPRKPALEFQRHRHSDDIGHVFSASADAALLTTAAQQMHERCATSYEQQANALRRVELVPG